MNIPRFHLAFPVHDIKSAKDFYSGFLGCELGRESKNWVDFNLFGHQIVAHLSPEDCIDAFSNSVDGDQVPVRHFGVILPWNKWENFCAMINEKEIPFVIMPKIRFKGLPGEQGTFFIQDPSGNILEFKSFKNDINVFAK
tara:strand:- start:88 stop:507 length:420 start_codon:yes stop_codon:yes gene_type:complete